MLTALRYFFYFALTGIVILLILKGHWLVWLLGGWLVLVIAGSFFGGLVSVPLADDQG